MRKNKKALLAELESVKTYLTQVDKELQVLKEDHPEVDVILVRANLYLAKHNLDKYMSKA